MAENPYLQGENVEDYDLQAQATPEDGAQLAVDLVNAGKADCIMKGLIETDI